MGSPSPPLAGEHQPAPPGPRGAARGVDAGQRLERERSAGLGGVVPGLGLARATPFARAQPLPKRLVPARQEPAPELTAGEAARAGQTRGSSFSAQESSAPAEW